MYSIIIHYTTKLIYLNPNTENDGAKLNTPKNPNTPKNAKNPNTPKKLKTENGTNPNTENGTNPKTPKKLNTENGTNENVVIFPVDADIAELPFAFVA